MCSSDLFTLAALRAEFEINESSASAAIEVTVAGFTAGGSKSWSWGPKPILARANGTTLVLNVGSDGKLRGDDYKDIIDESYSITAGKQPGEIIVSAMGVEEHWKNITAIEGNFGTGRDYIYISPDVEKRVTVTGGAGDRKSTRLNPVTQ